MGRFALLLLLAACSTTPRSVRDLAGVWESTCGFQYTRVDVAENGEIRWESSGCLDEFHGRTTATVRGGELRLAEPMLEYPGDERRTLRYHRHGGREYLVAPEHRELADGDDLFAADFWWGFRRRLSRRVLEQRIADTTDGSKRAELLEEWAAWPVGRSDIPYLVGLAADDPSEEVRDTALFALYCAGRDDSGYVTDPALHEAVLKAMRERGLEESE